MPQWVCKIEMFLFMDNGIVHPQDTLLLRNVKVVCNPTVCTSMLQPLELYIIRRFKQVYRKHLLLNSVCLMGPEKNIKTENKCSASVAFHSSSLKNKSCREQLCIAFICAAVDTTLT